MFHKDLFGLRLQKIRKQSGESQKDISKLLSVHPNQISEIETGRTATTFENLCILCEHFNVSADYLLGLTNDPRPLRDEDMPNE